MTSTLKNNMHTPGPWFVADDHRTVYVRRSGGSEPGICATDGSVIAPVSSAVEQARNARLIAAAPELLEALRDLCVFVEHTSMLSTIEVVDNARAVIAKAIG